MHMHYSMYYVVCLQGEGSTLGPDNALCINHDMFFLIIVKSRKGSDRYSTV